MKSTSRVILQKICILFLAVLCVTTNPTQTAIAATALDSSIDKSTVFYDPSFNECAAGGIPAGTLPSFVPEPYNGAFTKGANEYNVAPALIAAIFTAENMWGIDPAKIPEHWPKEVREHPDPNANWPTSSAGATGPFQFLPSTFTGLKKKDGGKYDIKDIRNLAIAAEAAANYLASNNGATKDKQPTSEEWRKAIFRYNRADWYVNGVLKYYNFYNSAGSSNTGTPDASATNDGCGATANCNQGGTTVTGRAALICEARKFDKFGYLWGGGHEDAEKFMQRFNSAGGYDQPFKQILDCSGIVIVSIWNAFKVKTAFTTDSIINDTKNFKRIDPKDAQPGDIMVRQERRGGHMEIATTPGGTETFGAHTANAAPENQIGDAKGQRWTSAFVYIGNGSGGQ